MSTQFYFRALGGPLQACGQIHVGGYRGGWQFRFQGYLVEGGERLLRVSGDSALHVLVQVPRLMTRSWDDWKELLAETSGVIEDEHGTTYSFQEFEALVEEHAPGKRWGDGELLRSHYQELLRNEHRYGKIDPCRDWKDPRGFSFSASDFF